MSNNDKISALIKYLKKKGYSVTPESYYFNIDYSELESNFRIIFYSEDDVIKFQSRPYIKSKRGSQRVETMKVSLNRKDYKTGVFKKIREIQELLKPEAEKEYIQIVEKKKYASEIEEYFMEKFGATSINIKPLNIHPNHTEDRNIMVMFNDIDKSVTQEIFLIDGKYSLMEEIINFKGKIIFSEKSPD